MKDKEELKISIEYRSIRVAKYIRLSRDDGFTGTNFNRPGFQKMLHDIEDGKIDCIITKDLSSRKSTLWI